MKTGWFLSELFGKKHRWCFLVHSV